MALETTNSIVDYLKSKGQAYDYTSRQKMYTEAGLSTRLGDYMGSAQQNTALLNKLNTPMPTTPPLASTTAQPPAITQPQEWATPIGTPQAYAAFETQQAGALAQDWRSTTGQQFVPLPITEDITKALANIKPSVIREAKIWYEQMRDRGDPPAWIANRLLQEFPREALISLGVPLSAVSMPSAPGPVSQAVTQPTTQPVAQPTQPEQPVQPVPENIERSKSGEFYTVGTDVFRAADDRKLTLQEFKDLGLNFEFIPKGKYAKRGEDVLTPEGQLMTLPEFKEKGLNFELLPEATIKQTIEAGGTPTPQETSKLTAQGILDLISQKGGDEQADILEKVLGTAEMDLASEIIKGMKEAERKRAAGEKTAIEQKMASQGLAFSGMRQAALGNADAESLAKMLDIDQKLAGIILKAVREEQGAREKVSTQQRQEAITALRDLGWAINPITGELEPTLAAQKEERVAQTALEQLGLAEQRLQLAEEKFGATTELQEARLALETARLSLAQEKATTVTPKGTTGATYTSRLNQEISNLYAGRYGTEGAREQAIKMLQSEFPNVDVSKDIYSRVPDGFEKQIKGIQPTQWEYDAGIWQWLAGEGAGLSDEEKKQQIQQMGRNPENFGIY